MIFDFGLENSLGHWSAPVGFGIRGCTVGVLAIASTWYLAHLPDKHYQVLSIRSFSMSAWLSCGLGSIGAWAAYPEYGNFKDAKRQLMAIIQVYFALGFGFQLLAALLDRQPTISS